MRTLAKLPLTFLIATLPFVVVLIALSAMPRASAASSDDTTSTQASGGEPVQPVGVYTVDQAASGKKLFFQYCEVCHGDKLQGKVGPALAGEPFARKWERGNLTADDLFYIMSTQMPQTDPGSLEANQYIDLLAFVLQQNDWPSGDVPLPNDSDALSKIVLVPQADEETTPPQ